MIATLTSGHHDLADWLLLIAVILFVLAWIFHIAGPSTVADKLLNATSLMLLGLASLALALFVT